MLLGQYLYQERERPGFDWDLGIYRLKMTNRLGRSPEPLIIITAQKLCVLSLFFAARRPILLGASTAPRKSRLLLRSPSRAPRAFSLPGREKKTAEMQSPQL